MIKNIVFDMGNVLISYDTRRYLDKYVQYEEGKEILLKEVFNSIEWLRMDRGTMESDDAIKSICKRVPEKYHNPVVELIKNWHMDIPSYEEMESLVKRVKEAGYKIYLLSNTSSRYYKFRVNIPALRYFDGEFISADWRLLKPDLQIYKKFFNYFSLKPSECYFIDDSIVNIEAANEAGMKGFVYRKNIEELKVDMKKNNINI